MGLSKYFCCFKQKDKNKAVFNFNDTSNLKSPLLYNHCIICKSDTTPLIVIMNKQLCVTCAESFEEFYNDNRPRAYM